MQAVSREISWCNFVFEVVLEFVLEFVVIQTQLLIGQRHFLRSVPYLRGVLCGLQDLIRFTSLSPGQSELRTGQRPSVLPSPGHRRHRPGCT
jgi:hypothetical protein